jgi:hypothetical protein
MAKLLKIPDVDYAIVMERLSHELRLRWDAVAQEVQRLTPRELFHPLVAKFAVPMFEKQLKPSPAENSRTPVKFPPPEEHRTFCEKQKPLKTQSSSRKEKRRSREEESEDDDAQLPLKKTKKSKKPPVVESGTESDLDYDESSE